MARSRYDPKGAAVVPRDAPWSLPTNLILLGAFLLLLSIFVGLVSSRIGAPLLLAFLALGMFFGEDGPGGIYFDNYFAAYVIGSMALAIILFDGGLRTDSANFRIAVWPALLLATVGVAVTAALTGVAAHWLLGLDSDRKLSDRRRGRLDRRRGGLLPPAPAWPRHQAAGAQRARGGIRPERPDRGLPDGRLRHAAARRQRRAGVEPGSRLRQSDRRRCGNRPRSGVYPGLADQPARARLRPLSDPRHGMGAVHFRRRAGARRQRLSRGLPRRADRRQPAASGGAADQPLP